jgi:hypothetical protein
MRSTLFWVIMQCIVEVTITCCIVSQKSVDLTVFLVVSNRFESTKINTKMTETGNSGFTSSSKLQGYLSIQDSVALNILQISNFANNVPDFFK